MLGSCACRMASSRAPAPAMVQGGLFFLKILSPTVSSSGSPGCGGQGVARTLLSWALCLQCIILTCVLLLQAVLVTVP